MDATREADILEDKDVVLVVEDHHMWQKLFPEILQQILPDAQAVVAGDVPEARRLFVDHRNRLILILHDANIPDETGVTGDQEEPNAVRLIPEYRSGRYIGPILAVSVDESLNVKLCQADPLANTTAVLKSGSRTMYEQLHRLVSAAANSRQARPPRQDT